MSCQRSKSRSRVHAPLRAVYDQWTQFEEFPKSMEGIVEELGNAFGVPDRRAKGDLTRFKELGVRPDAA